MQDTLLVALIGAGVGLLAGLAMAAAVVRRRRTEAAAAMGELRRLLDEQQRSGIEQRDAAINAALAHLVTSGQSLMASERELARRELDAKKSLIDQRLDALAAKLDDVTGLVTELEADRARKLGELSAQLVQQHEHLSALVQTTQNLREALSSTKARGQWGERMAEDVLRLAGFVENVNYRKQRAIEGSRSVPDYTFLLPNDLKLHMDVKFPLDNYLRSCEASSDLERKRYGDAFLRDVRARVKELAARSYIDPAGGTVDFVLLFIPNEQLYAFIHEHDGAVLDDAVRQGVVFCSPLTLFAVLALIRQMIENFQLARTSDEILGLLGEFSDQWRRFVDQMGRVGRRLEDATKEFEALTGTRQRQLEKPLRKIDQLRSQRDPSLALVDDETESPLALEA